MISSAQRFFPLARDGWKHSEKIVIYYRFTIINVCIIVSASAVMVMANWPRAKGSTMSPNKLMNFSRLMSSATLLLIIGMLLLNAACWVYPALVKEYGFGFNLTAASIAGDFKVDVAHMPWWQVCGGIVLSSVPLLMLAKGLNALRLLFKLYSGGEYFTAGSALLLGQVGRAVFLWVAFSFVLTPAMSVWVTSLLPVGQRMLTIGFDSSQLVSLFLAASIMVIASVHHKAAVLADENKQFI